jgi:Tfp pilus assembly protein PilV
MASRASAAPLRSQGGDSLLEVLVALGILGVAVTACAQLLVYSLGTQSRVAQREAAGRLLADASELTQAWPTAWPATLAGEWQTDVTQHHRGPQAQAPDLQLLSVSGVTPLRLQVSLDWSAGANDQLALLLGAYATALASTP